MKRSLEKTPREYWFGDIRFIPDRQLLLHRGRQIRVGTRALDLLHLLVSRPGEVVSKEELTRFAWPRTHVHESNLKVNIAALRRALPRAPADPHYIATVPGRGYRFVAPLSVSGASATPLPDAVRLQSGALPAIPALIGREDAIAALEARLLAGGLVTVTGPAGVGKTTIAVAAAAALAERYRDGVRFVDLAALADPLLVAPAIAAAIGIDRDFTNAAAALIDALRDKAMLLLLDNCEHLLSATAAIAEQLRRAAPGVAILATSREPLRSQPETVYRLAALPSPEAGAAVDAASALAYPAVALFVARAEEAHGYRLDDRDAPAVAAICRRLDGIALAIELAVPALAAAGPAALLALLERSFAPLDLGTGSGAPRHQTLLATLDWSYRLLSHDEAALFRLLSVFAGGFAFEDIVGVAEAGIEDLMAATERLVAKSLLSVAWLDGGLRYRLLDSTRSFAAAALARSGEADAAQRRHARYLLQLFERAEREWSWRARDDWTASYAPRANDLRKAIDWAFGAGGEPHLGIRLTVAAIPFWDELSTVGESRLRVERALQAEAESALCSTERKMKLVASYASGLNFSDHLGPEADAAWNKAYRLAGEAGNVDYRLRTLWGLAVLQSFSGRHRQALATLDRFFEIAEREQEHSATPDGARLKWMTRFYCGDIGAARDGLEALAARHGDEGAQTRMARFQIDRSVGIRVALATNCWVQGDYRRAMACTQAALDRCAALGHRVSQSNALAQAALPVALGLGDLDAARDYAAMLAHNLNLREIAIWGPVCRFFEAAIAGEAGDAGSVDAMHAAVAALIANNFLVRVPFYLAMAAEAALKFGRVALARDTIASAFEHAARQEEWWCRPELLRVRGLVLGREGDPAGAQAQFAQAVDAAVASGAGAFELRAATALAELLHALGRDRQASATLEPAFARFDPCFPSRDVARAGALLAALAGA